ncbi:MAG: peptidoglycan/LPS O-acetylase OafA/YrhL [Psychroserpens sp.]|jgi:peptidoglycan/LPS O-acetylase OafA/YrhL
MRLVALDLIRFFAAMAVVLYHYTAREGFKEFEGIAEVTKFGYLGVPLFFIISGYVIALSAKNRTAMEFAISRFVRLYPAYWCGMVFTILVTIYYAQVSFDPIMIAANATMLNDYFDIENIDGVYWTLQAELKFYACMFLLIFFGVFEKYKIWLTAWVFLTVTFLIFGQPFFMGWFISPYYSSFFIAGIAFYLIQNQGKNCFNMSILVLSLIISAAMTYQQTNSFFHTPSETEKMLAIMLVVCFYLIFYCLITGRLTIKGRKIYIVLGGLTYPLYLIHGLAGTSIIDYYRFSYSDTSIVLVTIALMLFFSWLIHVGIEKKFATPIKIYLLNKLSRNKCKVKIISKNN